MDHVNILLLTVLYCCSCRSGSTPMIGTVRLATDNTSADISLSRQSNDSAYSSALSFDEVLSPRPSLALRHLIRSASPPSHVAVRTGISTPSPDHLATAHASVATGDASTVEQRRLSRTGSSAQRFRNMVLQCREGDWPSVWCCAGCQMTLKISAKSSVTVRRSTSALNILLRTDSVPILCHHIGSWQVMLYVFVFFYSVGYCQEVRLHCMWRGVCLTIWQPTKSPPT